MQKENTLEVNDIQMEIDIRRKEIEKEYNSNLNVLYINIEQVARLCRAAAISKNEKNIFIGKGSFTNFCMLLRENDYTYMDINRYLMNWKNKLFDKLI